MLARHCNTHRTQDFTAQILPQPCTHNMVPAEQSFKQRASGILCRVSCVAQHTPDECRAFSRFRVRCTENPTAAASRGPEQRQQQQRLLFL